MGLNARDWRLLQDGLDQMQEGAGRSATLLNLVRLAVEAGNSSSGSLYLLDPRRKVLKPAVLIGLPEDYVALCGNVRVGDQCCGRAVQAKKPWVVKDMLKDPLFATARKAAKSTGIRSAFSVPVFDANGDCIGSLACHYRTPHTPTNYELERNRLFATLIGFALSSEEATDTSRGTSLRAAKKGGKSTAATFGAH